MAKTVKLMNTNHYNVFILPEAREKMELYCELCDKEIGWMGFVEEVSNIGYLITDFVLLKQEVHETTTEIDPSALLELWNETPVEKQSKIKVWGHSHVNMAPNPSGQDDSQMDYFKDGNDWFIRLITNKKGDMNITIYDYKNGIEVHDDQLITYSETRIENRKAISEEIKEKVSIKKTITYSKSYSTTGSTLYSNYKTKDKNARNIEKSSEPIFKGIEVKYVSSFDEALSDPLYWQDVIKIK